MQNSNPQGTPVGTFALSAGERGPGQESAVVVDPAFVVCFAVFCAWLIGCLDLSVSLVCSALLNQSWATLSAPLCCCSSARVSLDTWKAVVPLPDQARKQGQRPRTLVFVHTHRPHTWCFALLCEAGFEGGGTHTTFIQVCQQQRQCADDRLHNRLQTAPDDQDRWGWMKMVGGGEQCVMRGTGCSTLHTSPSRP